MMMMMMMITATHMDGIAAILTKLPLSQKN